MSKNKRKSPKKGENVFNFIKIVRFIGIFIIKFAI